MDDMRRLSTGLPGLDAILNGGVFRGGMYIVQGVPGSGKTILGNQICYAEAARGGRVLYMTLLAETHSRMLAHLSQMTFFKHEMVPDQVAYIGAFATLEESGLRGLLDLIRSEVRRRKIDLLVLDGMATVGESVSSDLELKKFVHELQTQALFTNCTMFLLTSGMRKPLSNSAEYTMVDGLIELKTRMFGRRAERQLQVHKLRGSDFNSGEHSFRITADGVQTFPRIEAALAIPSHPNEADGRKVSTGAEGLDDVMGGGVDRHSNTVILGPAGSGKTILGLQFLSACRADEPGLLFSFFENEKALRIKAAALKLPLAARLESGQVEVVWQPAAEGLVDEVCWQLLGHLRRRKVRRLFLDGIDGFARLIPEEAARFENVLIALCNELRGLGVTTFLTAETELAGIVPGQPLSGLTLKGLSPIAENIVVLRLAAVRADIQRLIAVIKARDSHIDLAMRRFTIAEGGVSIEANSASADAVLRELMQQGQQLLAARATDVRSGE